MTDEGSAGNVKEFKLREDQELRIEAASDGDGVVVELVDGLAEVFGTELVQHKKYTYRRGAKFAIFTWHGCTVEIVGKTESAYVASQTPMVRTRPTYLCEPLLLRAGCCFVESRYLLLYYLLIRAGDLPEQPRRLGADEASGREQFIGEEDESGSPFDDSWTDRRR